METELIPRYLLRKICAKNGQRLPKRERFKPETKLLPMANTGYDVQSFGRRGRGTRFDVISVQIEREVKTLADKKFDFQHWEYRFWCVECGLEGPELAICRGCLSAFFQVKARKAHLGQGCSQKILTAYALLLRDKLCVVCDKHTSNQVWGVPLCNSNLCKDTFEHEEAQTSALERALEIDARTKLLENM
jgi:hypothetical protein